MFTPIINNMSVRHLLLLFLYSLIILPSAAQPITKLEPGRTPEGAVYFLPKTAVRITLLVERKVYQPGQYAQYADQFLHLSNVELDRQTTYSIVDYAITTIGQRDTSKCYSIRLKGGKCETAELKMSEDGVLLAVNDEPIATVARQAFRSAPKSKATDPRKYLNAEVLAASSLSRQAELIATQIAELQESRHQLITGEADEMPEDERQLSRMLREIDMERDGLMSLFTGTVTRDTTEHTLTVCPTAPTEREVLFRLSAKRGLVDKDDLSGTPFFMSVENLYPAEHPTPENKKLDGFYVNRPGMARLTLLQDERQLAAFELPLAQFGFVELLDGSLFKKYVTHMRLHPATGAVDSLQADDEKK